ncbi:MAG: hypothetical protein JSW33_01070 [bacterium]|nr:MAG: hypothetical protein JSW33_01070 [bacterium]
MKRVYRTCLLLTMIIILWYLPGQLGAGIIAVDKDGSRTLISDGKMKMESPEEGTIMDGGSGMITYYNMEKMVYSRGTEKEYCEAMSNLMEELLSSVPDAYKNMMGLGDEKNPPKVEIIGKGSGGKIAGFETELFEVMADGKLYETVWLSQDEELKRELKPVLKMLTNFYKCSQMMTKLVPVESTPEYENLLNKGIILKSVEFQDDLEDIAEHITEISIQDIPDEEFTVPADYMELSFSEYFRAQMQEDESSDFDEDQY